MSHDFSLNPRLKVSLDHVGEEREPVLIVEDLAARPGDLVDFAATEVAFAPAYGPGGGYPGIRAPAPLDYVGRLARSLAPVVEEAFGLKRVKLARAECNFSLVTLSAEQLAPSQRAPHADAVDPLQFAFLHYLCGDGFGGTAFYRHRATGFETIDAGRVGAFNAALAKETAPAGYIVGDDAHYIRIGAAGARFNRLIVYRSRLLHSGLIGSETLSADPRRGRLTANLFVNYRQL